MDTADDQPVETRDALRLTADRSAVEESCLVVIEQPVTITVEGVGSYTLMCTPRDLMPLAVGFAFTEGIIDCLSDIDLLHCCDDEPSAIRLVLARPAERASERNLIVSSACGLCGSTDVQKVIESLPKTGDSFSASLHVLLSALAEMKSRQTIFERTGGTHAAAIFAAQGEILSFAEDTGRHNALDKAIGKLLLEQKPTAGYGVALSGRISLEMVAKSARAGLEVVAAVSAPTSLAIKAAEACGITLCGFVRGDRATIYTHPGRVIRGTE